MKKKSAAAGGLNKSTKVTLLSCASFIGLTMIILIFFVMFPITPSEKIMASIGRENVSGSNDNSSVTAVPNGETTTSAQTTAATDSNTARTGRTTTKTVNIVITTGSGFMQNGRIPTGFTIGDTNTTVSEDPVVPTPDPGYTYPIYTQPATEPYEPEVPNPPSTDVDPNPPVTQPTTPVDPDPPVTSPPVVPTEPQTPDQPAPVVDEPQSE